MRGWWEEDEGERELFFAALGAPGPCPGRMTRALHARIIEHCLGAGSILSIFQLQDLLDLDEELWAPDPRGDRINVPGTVNDQNWTWRMPLDLAALAAREGLVSGLGALVARRRARALDGGSR